jgi:hypothetical protein
MAISLLVVDGVEVSALRFRQGQAATHGGGSGRRLGGRSGFRVDTPLNVLTATSTAWTLGPCAAMVDAAATLHQGVYGWSSDSNISGAVTAADATYSRKDIVYIQVNDSSAGDGSGALNANVTYLAGSPSATPIPPNLPARSFLLGTISVPQAGGGSPTVSLNTARYAAAGAALPVYSEFERDSIPDKFDGLIVQRRDLPGRPDQVWDGTAWNGQWWTSYTPAWAGFANVGAGAQATGSYMMVGPNLCTVRMKLKAGTGASLGLGNIAVSLPFTSAADQATLGKGAWFATGIFGAFREVTLSNPPSNIQASILSVPGGAGQGVSPGNGGFPYGDTTEVHATITYRTA